MRAPSALVPASTVAKRARVPPRPPTPGRWRRGRRPNGGSRPGRVPPQPPPRARVARVFAWSIRNAPTTAMTTTRVSSSSAIAPSEFPGKSALTARYRKGISRPGRVEHATVRTTDFHFSWAWSPLAGGLVPGTYRRRCSDGTGRARDPRAARARRRYQVWSPARTSPVTWSTNSGSTVPGSTTPTASLLLTGRVSRPRLHCPGRLSRLVPPFTVRPSKLGTTLSSCGSSSHPGVPAVARRRLRPTHVPLAMPARQ